MCEPSKDSSNGWSRPFTPQNKLPLQKCACVSTGPCLPPETPAACISLIANNSSRAGLLRKKVCTRVHAPSFSVGTNKREKGASCPVHLWAGAHNWTQLGGGLMDAVCLIPPCRTSQHTHAYTQADTCSCCSFKPYLHFKHSLICVAICETLYMEKFGFFSSTYFRKLLAFACLSIRSNSLAF